MARVRGVAGDEKGESMKIFCVVSKNKEGYFNDVELFAHKVVAKDEATATQRFLFYNPEKLIVRVFEIFDKVVV
jgi:hypothetical protein